MKIEQDMAEAASAIIGAVQLMLQRSLMPWRPTCLPWDRGVTIQWDRGEAMWNANDPYAPKFPSTPTPPQADDKWPGVRVWKTYNDCFRVFINKEVRFVHKDEPTVHSSSCYRLQDLGNSAVQKHPDVELYGPARAAVLERLMPVQTSKPKAETRWVKCPICGEPDMRCEQEDGGVIINCTNLACGSNGGTNFRAVQPIQPTPSPASVIPYSKLPTCLQHLMDNAPTDYGCECIQTAANLIAAKDRELSAIRETSKALHSRLESECSRADTAIARVKELESELDAIHAESQRLRLDNGKLELANAKLEGECGHLQADVAELKRDLSDAVSVRDYSVSATMEGGAK